MSAAKKLQWAWPRPGRQALWNNPLKHSEVDLHVHLNRTCSKQWRTVRGIQLRYS